MREILFRGQTRKKGEKVRLDGSPVESHWVYGGVLQGKGDFSIIYQTEPEIEKFSVYSDTLGQYTGLTDKNGTKIFEGDILKNEKGTIYSGSYSNEVVFRNGMWFAVGFVAFSPNEFELYEVIGNIHDNPELLKVIL